MRSLRHPHIVELHFSFQDDSHVYLGMEFAEGGGMFDLLSKYFGLSWYAFCFPAKSFPSFSEKHGPLRSWPNVGHFVYPNVV